ncbi:hypothetical protein AB0M47_23250 [Hamadaea sp. NPDC051192]|uniref:hypothetical protein n=1 Tax=Hamadaea sp. NPDC051192 TaxID=3154940 RepID=UPI00343A1A3A
MISLGAVVENTSSQVADQATLVFGYADSSSRDARADDAAGLIVAVPLIRPGEKVPVGTYSYVRQKPSGDRVDVAQLQVTGRSDAMGPAQRPATRRAAQPRSLTKSSVDDQSGTLDYTATVSSCRTLIPRGVSMVFRDDTGKIVGGGLDLNSHEQCVPGQSTGQAVITRSLPPTAVAAKTQIWPLCDLAAKATVTGPSARSTEPPPSGGQSAG